MSTDTNAHVDLAYITSRRFGRSPDILECLANLSSDEVFTHPRVVNEMLDLLPANVWTNPHLKWLDPCCKSGVFLREIAKRLLVSLAQAIPDENERREHIFRNMLYGIGITAITSEVARRSLYCSKDANGRGSAVLMPTQAGNIFFEDSAHAFVGSVGKRTCKYCGAPDPMTLDAQTDRIAETHAYTFIHPNKLTILKTMKFDVIIGNPPYQLKDGSGGRGSSAKPIYHLFVGSAKKLNPRYLSMIIPSRWFSGGKGLNDFREAMLSDTKISALVDYPNSQDCFPDVEIKGGVCYFLRSLDYNGQCNVTTKLNGKESTVTRALNTHGVFVRFNQSISILGKVQDRYPSLSKRVLSRKPFGLESNFNSYTVPSEDTYLCYKQGGTGNMLKTIINNNNIKAVNSWKVLVSKGYGAGEGYPHQIIGRPIVAGPGSVCTETYLVLDFFKTRIEAENFSKYVATRFFRFLVALHKNTQNTHKESYMFVPQLDMTQAWDDETLYKHFSITPTEREFIESLIKEME